MLRIQKLDNRVVTEKDHFSTSALNNTLRVGISLVPLQMPCCVAGRKKQRKAKLMERRMMIQNGFTWASMRLSRRRRKPSVMAVLLEMSRRLL